MKTTAEQGILRVAIETKKFGLVHWETVYFVIVVTVRDKPGKVFAFAYLKPLRKDGTTIVDGTHQLVLYKVNLLYSVYEIILSNNVICSRALIGLYPCLDKNIQILKMSRQKCSEVCLARSVYCFVGFRVFEYCDSNIRCVARLSNSSKKHVCFSFLSQRWSGFALLTKVQSS